MALVITFTPGESFDETGDTITLNKLNRVINSGTGQISSGSIDTDNIGNLQVTVAKLADALDFTGKAVTLPVGIDLSKGIATGSAIGTLEGQMGVPAYKGQIGVLANGKVFISKGILSTADWVYGGDLIVTGTVSPANLTEDSRSSLGTPDAVGQWAIDSAGVTYRAQEPDEGSLTHNDWLPIRTHTVDLKNQVTTDPDVLDDYVRLYAKGNSLFMKDSEGVTSQVNRLTSSESIYIRYVLPKGQSGADIASNSWETVPFNQNAGVAPFEDIPGGPYEWFIDQDFTTYAEIELMVGTYDYNYAVEFHLSESYPYVEGRAQLYFSDGGGEVVEFSESLTLCGRADQEDEYYFHNMPVSMVGQFAIIEPKHLRLRVWVSSGAMNYGQGAPGSGTEPDIQEVYAYLKITKVS